MWERGVRRSQGEKGGFWGVRTVIQRGATAGVDEVGERDKASYCRFAAARRKRGWRQEDVRWRMRERIFDDLREVEGGRGQTAWGGGSTSTSPGYPGGIVSRYGRMWICIWIGFRSMGKKEAEPW
jgi:hypothetical protein